MNQYISEKDEIIRNIRLVRQVVADMSELELKQAQAADEMNAVDALFKKSIAANARVAQDQAEYRKHQAELTEWYAKAENEYNRLGEEIAEKRARNLQLGQILNNLEVLDGTVMEFDAGMWGTFLWSMTVYEGKRIVGPDEVWNRNRASRHPDGNPR